MVTVRQGFSVVTKVFTVVNDRWPAAVLSAGFWLVKITNLLSKKNISFASNIDWKKKHSQFHLTCNHVFFKPWSAKPTKWSNTLKQFVGNLQFVGWRLNFKRISGYNSQENDLIKTRPLISRKFYCVTWLEFFLKFWGSIIRDKALPR